MYVTMRNYTGTTWTDEQAKRVQSEFLPILRKVKGFKDYYCVDGGNGALSTISVFDDKVGAEESTRTADSWVKDNLKTALPNAPKILSGTVIAH
jgi:hypothetical protein